MTLKSDFWGAIAGSVIVVGIPALVWGGSITAKVENLTKQQDTSRQEIRDDLTEINRKLDMLTQHMLKNENKGK